MIELWTHSLLVCRVGASDHDRNEAKSEDPPCSLGQDDRQLLADLVVRNLALLGQDRGPLRTFGDAADTPFDRERRLPLRDGGIPADIDAEAEGGHGGHLRLLQTWI